MSVHDPINTNVRRKNREVKDEAFIKEMLHKAAFGSFALSLENQPYLNINLFIYSDEENCIYFHTAGEGHSKNIIQQNPNVCFSVFEMGRLLPGKKAIDFSTEYKCVIVFGKIEIITDINKASEVMNLYFKKYSSGFKIGVDFKPFEISDVEKTTVYKINILKYTAKQNKQPDDYEGAYWYKPV